MTTSPAEPNPDASGTDDEDTAEAHRPDKPPAEGTGTPQDALPPE